VLFSDKFRQGLAWTRRAARSIPVAEASSVPAASGWIEEECHEDPLYPIVLPLMLGLAACVTEYSKSEAPDQLRGDGAESRRELTFATGSAYLDPGCARDLDRWGAQRQYPTGRYAYGRRGRPPETRRATCATVFTRAVALRHRNPNAHARRGAGQWRDPLGRPATRLSLPTCPNWSQSLSYEFTNAFSSNYGCANTTNLGLMVASPADLVSGRTLAPADGQPAVAAVTRYLNDRGQTPAADDSISPFAGWRRWRRRRLGRRRLKRRSTWCRSGNWSPVMKSLRSTNRPETRNARASSPF